jgi:hypothetical protein
VPGAPGLDFETWDTSNLNSGCPTLAAHLFLRLEWETSNLNRPAPQEIVR